MHNAYQFERLGRFHFIQDITVQLIYNRQNSNRSPGNFNILAELSNIQNNLYVSDKYILYLIEVSTETIILFHHLDEYSYSVKSRLPIPFIRLKSGKIKET